LGGCECILVRSTSRRRATIENGLGRGSVVFGMEPVDARGRSLVARARTWLATVGWRRRLQLYLQVIFAASPRQRGEASLGSPHATDAHSPGAPTTIVVRGDETSGSEYDAPLPFATTRSRPAPRARRSCTTTFILPATAPS